MRGGTQPKLTPMALLVAIVAAIGGLVFGFDIGGGGGSFVMPGFQRQFVWIDADGNALKSEAEVAEVTGWISALLTLGAAAGAAPSGILADRFGRRPCIITSAVIFSFGALMQSLAFGPEEQALAILYVGRLIGGVGIGMLSATVPVYISECAPEHARGMLSTMWQFAIVLGIVLASLVNLPLATWEHGWRFSYGGNVLFAVFLGAPPLRI